MGNREHFDTGHGVPYFTEKGTSYHTDANPATQSDVFSGGQCHALAHCVYKEEGHPIGAVADHDGYVDHFVNIHKSTPNMIHDGSGWRSSDDFYDDPKFDWADSITPISEAKFKKHIKSEHWLPMATKAASAYLKHLRT
jgi:hypothetical protein